MKNLLIGLLGIPFLLGVNDFIYAAEKKAPPKASSVATGASCLKEKAEFKKLYIELQKSLNYEGKDAYLDAKGALQLKAHEGAAYEGKVFEEALFKEYQNSLRKVALMYQAAKFDSAAPEDFKANPSLVDFVKAIDGNDGAKYIAGNNVNAVIDGLQKASVSKYPADSKFRINENDKYLLKKLLTHAQDRLCSIEKYQETGKRDRNFTAEELEKKKNAPLNQLILAIKDAKITKDSDIKFEDIVDEKTAINSAIAANINALSTWMKKNKACLPALKTVGSMNTVQAGIQACNYRKFVDALSDDNVSNIESILHFINSNEKFLKGAQAKAETSMDELKLQAYVDRTFANLSNKINCTEIPNANKVGKRLFVRNLAYNDSTNKFDTSKLSCKVKVPASKKGPASERVLTEQECTSKIELVSDELGRGLEVKQKNPKEAPISFSVKDNPECNDITLVTPALNEEIKTPEICKAEGEAMVPKKELVPSEDKKSCVVKVNPPVVTLSFKTPESCKAEGEAMVPKKELVPSEDKKSCVEKKSEEKTDAICAEEGKKQNPVKDLVASEDKKSCVEKKSEEKTDAICAEEGKKQNPAKDLVVSEDKKSCVEKKKEEPTESAAEKECAEKNKKLSDANDGRPFSNWQVKDGKCIDTKYKAPAIKDTEFEEADKPVRADNSKFNTPARFTPINIPTRQMYILPGMP